MLIKKFFHLFEQMDHCDYDDDRMSDLDETDDLIESEAIALTEDAIFLAKRELYREVTKNDDQRILEIAQSIVNSTIDGVINDMHHHFSTNESVFKIWIKI